MPTYIVKTSNIKLDKNKKNKIAMGITETHKKITGADSFFAQVLFEVNNKKSHFMGGKIIKDKQIFLSGQIRAGRSVNIKKKLILNLRKSLEINSKIKKDNIWVYLLEIMPNQMIEYGEILPKSGQETKWLNSLSKSLQTKLKKINK